MELLKIIPHEELKMVTKTDSLIKKTGSTESTENKRKLQFNNILTKEQQLLQLKELTQEMESIFIYQTLKVMRRTVPKSEFLNGGMAEDIFQGMLDEEYSKKMSQASTLGLGQLLYEQLKVGIQ